MFIEQPPWFYRALFPGVTWRIPAEPKCVYLTFDDGPIPEVTPWVLDILDQYGVKATFFMVGDNVRKHPDIYRMVVERGHRIGNHTFNHIQGIRFLIPTRLPSGYRAICSVRPTGTCVSRRYSSCGRNTASSCGMS